MIRYWIEMAFFMHLVLCVIGVYDLYVETNLRPKVKFFFLICALPLAGFLIFEEIKKRCLRDSAAAKQ